MLDSSASAAIIAIIGGKGGKIRYNNIQAKYFCDTFALRVCLFTLAPWDPPCENTFNRVHVYCIALLFMFSTNLPKWNFFHQFPSEINCLISLYTMTKWLNDLLVCVFDSCVSILFRKFQVKECKCVLWLTSVFTWLAIEALKGIPVPPGRLLFGAPPHLSLGLIQDTISVFEKAMISISSSLSLPGNYPRRHFRI